MPDVVVRKQAQERVLRSCERLRPCEYAAGPVGRDWDERPSPGCCGSTSAWGDRPSLQPLYENNEAAKAGREPIAGRLAPNSQVVTPEANGMHPARLRLRPLGLRILNTIFPNTWPAAKPLMDLCGVDESVGCRNWDFDLRLLHSEAEMIGLEATGDRVVGLDVDGGPLPQLRLHSVAGYANRLPRRTASRAAAPTRRLPRTRHGFPPFAERECSCRSSGAAKAAGRENSRFFSVFRTNSVANLSALSWQRACRRSAHLLKAAWVSRSRPRRPRTTRGDDSKPNSLRGTARNGLSASAQ